MKWWIVETWRHSGEIIRIYEAQVQEPWKFGFLTKTSKSGKKRTWKIEAVDELGATAKVVRLQKATRT